MRTAPLIVYKQLFIKKKHVPLFSQYRATVYSPSLCLNVNTFKFAWVLGFRNNRKQQGQGLFGFMLNPKPYAFLASIPHLVGSLTICPSSDRSS